MRICLESKFKSLEQYQIAFQSHELDKVLRILGLRYKLLLLMIADFILLFHCTISLHQHSAGCFYMLTKHCLLKLSFKFK